MDVKTEKLVDFLGQPGAIFSIPLFQRPYSWEEWECQVLWDDIVKAAEEEKPHFFGAILYKRSRSDEGATDISLIDGQQRTLSMLLVLSAFRDFLNASGERPDGMDGSLIEQRFLACSSSMKVAPSDRDTEPFRIALLHAEPEAGDDAGSRALANKRFFSEQMANADFDAAGFWKGIGLLQIVAVGLTDDDDEQAIFESFNSKGVPLVTADLVRNYLLLSEDPAEQERLYNEQWLPMQALFGVDPGSLRMNNAIRAWTVIRCKAPHARSDVQAFSDFKQYMRHEYEGSAKDVLKELHGFCAVWAENYRYHAVKRFKSMDWASLGRKTLVSDRKRAAANPEAREFYEKHYGVPANEGSFPGKEKR